TSYFAYFRLQTSDFRLPLHLGFDRKALSIAIDRRDREPAARARVCHGTIARLERPVNRDRIPLLRVPDIVDGDVVMLAPEERHRVEPLAAAEHVARGHLALPFGDDPMLDANPIAAVRVRPSRDVAGGEDAGRARFEVLVHRDAAVHRET